MAEGIVTEPSYVLRLGEALQQRFGQGSVSWEPIRRDRYRFLVESDEFEGMGHPERQNLVWDLTEGVVPKEDLLKVGMILTIAPSDYPDANSTDSAIG